MIRTSRKTMSLAAGMAAVMMSMNVGAVDLHTVADVGVGHSDNLGRAQDGTGEADDIIRAGLVFSLLEESQKVNANIQGEIFRYKYQNNTFDDETLGFLNALVDFRITERVLGWSIQNNYGQQMVNIFQPIRPGNRESVNIFSTGPDFNFLFGARTGLDVALRWSDLRYETRPRDNQRTSANVRAYRQVSETRTFGLTVFGETVEFDDQTFNNDLDRYLASGSFTANSDRTNLSFDLGWNWIEVDQTKADGVYYNFSLGRQISGRSSLSFNAGHEFSDSGNLFQFYNGLNGRGNEYGAGAEDADLENTSDPFTNNFARLSYNFTGERTQWIFAADWREEDYEEQDLRDRKIYGLTGQVTRELTESLVFDLFGQVGRREFNAQSREDDDIRVGAGLALVLGQRWTVRVDYDYINRDSTDPNDSYTENRYFLSAQYTLVQ